MERQQRSLSERVAQKDDDFTYARFRGDDARSISSGDVLQQRLTRVREVAAAAVASDRAGDHRQAVDLYAAAATRCLDLSKSWHRGAAGWGSDQRAALLEMARAYIQRGQVLKTRLQKGHLPSGNEWRVAAGARDDGDLVDIPDYFEPEVGRGGGSAASKDAAERVGNDGDDDGDDDPVVVALLSPRTRFRNAATRVMLLNKFSPLGIGGPLVGGNEPSMKRGRNWTRRGSSAAGDSGGPLTGGRVIYRVIRRQRPLTKCDVTGARFLGCKEVPAAARRGALRTLYDRGQPHIIWCASVQIRSVYHRLFAKSRYYLGVVFLTPEALYVGSEEDLLRCIPLHAIARVITDPVSWVGLSVPSQYDVLFRPTTDAVRHTHELLALFKQIATAHAAREARVGAATTTAGSSSASAAAAAATIAACSLVDIAISIVHENINPYQLALPKPKGFEPPPWRPVTIEGRGGETIEDPSSPHLGATITATSVVSDAADTTWQRKGRGSGSGGVSLSGATGGPQVQLLCPSETRTPTTAAGGMDATPSTRKSPLSRLFSSFKKKKGGGGGESSFGAATSLSPQPGLTGGGGPRSPSAHTELSLGLESASAASPGGEGAAPDDISLRTSMGRPLCRDEAGAIIAAGDLSQRHPRQLLRSSKK